MIDAPKIVGSFVVAVVCWWAIGLAAVPAQDLPAFDPPPVAVEPLEVKMVGVEACAPGWERVSLDEGWTVYYPHPSGHFVPNWVTEAQFVAAFAGPSGRPVEAALDSARQRFRSSLRIICRWAPLAVLAAPAD